MTTPDCGLAAALAEMRDIVAAALGDCEDISTDAHGHGWTGIENAANAAYRALHDLTDEITKQEKDDAR